MPLASGFSPAGPSWLLPISVWGQVLKLRIQLIFSVLEDLDYEAVLPVVI